MFSDKFSYRTLVASIMFQGKQPILNYQREWRLTGWLEIFQGNRWGDPPVFELELPDLDHLGYHIFGVHNCGYRMGVSFFGGKLYQIYWLDYLEDKNK